MNTTNINRPIVIGIDHGFGQIKTAHTCFKTGVTAHDREPTFKNDLLIYEGRYYTIGEEHKAFLPNKASDQDYYILTLAAIARELRFRGLEYHITFAGAEVYPQGFSAIADKLRDFRGITMLCDIGNGTMNVMYIRSGKPIPSQCYTEKYGVQQCMIAVREKLMQRFGATVDDSIIEEVLRYGKSDIDERYLTVIQDCARDYANGIMKRLREHEYNPDLMRLYVMGGGGCLIRNFVDYDPARVRINSDINATAKEYERLAEAALRKRGGVA